jgi:ferredoxin
MPTITANNQTIEAPANQRLVQAIEDAGVDIGHRCGGNAKCTTCRVEFVSGEPDTMTQAEYDKLDSQGNLGKFRLSCQIVCDHDMSVNALMRQGDMGWDDPGPQVAETVTPEAVFISKADLG